MNCLALVNRKGSKVWHLLVLSSFLLLHPVAAANYDVPWGSVTAAGGESSSSTYVSGSTLGAGAGISMQSANYQGASGLLVSAPTVLFSTGSNISAGPAWKMVSVFYTPEISDVSTLFPDPELKLFYWDPNVTPTEEYLNFVRPTTLKEGKSVWIKMPNSSKTYSLTGQAIDQEFPYKVALGVGWNQIADPFTYPIPFASVQVIANSVRVPLQDAISAGLIKNALFSYAGSGYNQFDDATGVLLPGEGYFVYTSQPIEIVYFPVQANAAIAKRLAKLKEKPHRTRGAVKFSGAPIGEWTAKLSAKNEKAKDDDNFFGIRLSAKDKADKLDVPEPPKIEDSLTLYFDEESSPYVNSFKAIKARWNVVVKSKRNKLPVTLSWEGDSAFTEEGAVLIDWQKNDFIDMTQQNSYTFQMPLSNEAHFEIRAGKEAEGLFKLEKAFNFPNPTSSTIAFMLQGKGKPGAVEVEVYNVSGQKVFTTVLQPVSDGKGRYRARAKEAESASKSWANGVYFYRMRTPNGLGGESTTIGKMVLLR